MDRKFWFQDWLSGAQENNNSEACSSLRKQICLSGSKAPLLDGAHQLAKIAALTDDQETGLNNYSSRSMLLASNHKKSAREWSISSLIANPNSVSSSQDRTLLSNSNLGFLNRAMKPIPPTSKHADGIVKRADSFDMNFDFDGSVFDDDTNVAKPSARQSSRRSVTSDSAAGSRLEAADTDRVVDRPENQNVPSRINSGSTISSHSEKMGGPGFTMPHLKGDVSEQKRSNSDKLNSLLPKRGPDWASGAISIDRSTQQKRAPDWAIQAPPAKQPRLPEPLVDPVDKVAKVNKYVNSKLPAWVRDQVEDPSQLHKLPKWKLRQMGIDLADLEAEEELEAPQPAHRGWQRNQRVQRRKQTEIDECDETPSSNNPGFVTGRQQKAIDDSNRNGSYGGSRKTLGLRRGGTSTPFVPPVKSSSSDEGRCIRRGENCANSFKTNPGVSNGYSVGPMEEGSLEEEELDPRLKGIDKKLIELIKNEIMDVKSQITWEDIAGLEHAKKTIKEIVVWPMLRPDIFTGLRGPPKGLLLFGPPGTGKTLIGKCIASQSKSTFFSISASSLTSKWVGEGEKMVRALFAVARVNQPAVIFIDEIDSLLSQRSDTEHESSRRIKTEFLVQLDGATTCSEDRLLVIGATNRPQELDEAARRRLVKRLYIPLPDFEARRHLIANLMSKQENSLAERDIQEVCEKAGGYSGADMANLCREAALGPIRCIPFSQMENISRDQVRPITVEDFRAALTQVRASVSEAELDGYVVWNKRFGSSDIVQ